MTELAATAMTRRAWYVVAVLLAVYMVHHLDRMVVTLLLDPIGREFLLSDSQLGLLAGLAYAVPFAVAGMPLGMLVDRVNRVRLLTALVTVWSSLTALAAFATGFWTLLLARVGVAAAESGGTPTNVSIITDAVPDKRRTTALGVYYMGSSLGTVVGFAVAGAVAAEYGWRAGFLVAGLPGLALAVLLWRTVGEPARKVSAGHERYSAPPLGRALKLIWSSKPALHIIVASTIVGMVGIGLMTWLPALMIRNHGAGLALVGSLIAFAISPFGAIGSLVGGRIGDALHARNAARVPKFMATFAALTVPAYVFGILSPTLTGVVVGFALATIAQVVLSAPGYGTVMHNVAPEVRGVAAALMQVSSNVLGFGVGTQVIGVASDALRGWAPDESLRFAMLGLCVVNAWGALHFLLAARALERREPRPMTQP